MSQKFKEQGGVATIDPSSIRRWVTSKMMSAMASAERQQEKRRNAERKRVKLGSPHLVEYFHQVNDGYSHLSVQLLAKIVQRYDIQLECHLVRDTKGDNSPEPDLLLRLSRYDSNLIAPHYGLQATYSANATANAPITNDPSKTPLPSQILVDQATSILAGIDSHQFIEVAPRVSAALWQEDQGLMDSLVGEYSPANKVHAEAMIESGNARRAELGHYSGAMFFYGGEWYWGVDRLYHLEKRLTEMGLD